MLYAIREKQNNDIHSIADLEQIPNKRKSNVFGLDTWGSKVKQIWKVSFKLLQNMREICEYLLLYDFEKISMFLINFLRAPTEDFKYCVTEKQKK